MKWSDFYALAQFAQLQSMYWKHWDYAFYCGQGRQVVDQLPTLVMTVRGKVGQETGADFVENFWKIHYLNSQYSALDAARSRQTL